MSYISKKMGDIEVPLSQSSEGDSTAGYCDAYEFSEQSKFPRNFLSDHSVQSITANLRTKADRLCFTVNVATYNMLSRGYSKAVNGLYSNNPFDVDELTDDYFDRKYRQFLELGNLLKTHDFLLLQEVDFLTNSTFNYSTAQATQDYLKKLQLLKHQFHQLLAANNFAISMTSRSSSEIRQQLLVTLYRKNRFTLASSRGVFEAATPYGYRQFRGFETIFLVENTQAELVITNIHLRFGDPTCAAQIDSYQAEMEEKKSFSIIGGDANNPQTMLRHAIGDEREASTFSSSFDEKNTIRFSTVHDESGVAKSYDRFWVVAPPNFYLEVSCNKDINKHFIVNTKGNPCTNLSACAMPFRTLPGKRYRPTEELILDLLKKMKAENEELTTKKIDTLAIMTWPDETIRKERLLAVCELFKSTEHMQPSTRSSHLKLSVFALSSPCVTTDTLHGTPEFSAGSTV